MPPRGYELNTTYIANLAQGMRNVPNHFFGELAPPRDVDAGENPKHEVKNGEERLVFYWYAVDAETERQSAQVRETSIRKDHAISFAENELGPQNYWIWLPDSYESLPEKVDELPSQLDSEGPALGQFFYKFFYRPMRIQQKLEALAEKDFEETRKISDAIRSTSLDDELDDQVMRELRRVMSAAEGEFLQEDDG